MGRLIDKTKGGQNTKLHGACDGNGRIFAIHLTEGTASDYKGTKVLLGKLPKWTERLAADRGNDGDWVRNVLESMGIEPAFLEGRTVLLRSNTTPSSFQSETKSSALSAE